MLDPSKIKNITHWRLQEFKAESHLTNLIGSMNIRSIFEETLIVHKLDRIKISIYDFA